jgi:hypothetical protein
VTVDGTTASYRQSGAATVPGRESGQVSVSYPLARLIATPDGVSVAIRPRRLAASLDRLIHFSGGADTAWTASWEDINEVVVGPRSVVFVLRGRRGCRFATMTRRQIAPLFTLLETHHISTKRVRTTMARAFSI